jgi:hypothetical protein
LQIGLGGRGNITEKELLSDFDVSTFVSTSKEGILRHAFCEKSVRFIRF